MTRSHLTALIAQWRARSTTTTTILRAPPSSPTGSIRARLLARAKTLQDEAADWLEKSAMTGGYTSQKLKNDALENETSAELLREVAAALSPLSTDDKRHPCLCRHGHLHITPEGAGSCEGVGYWESIQPLFYGAKKALGVPFFERNGIRAGERVTHQRYPSKFGTVLYCADDGVQVLWDDGQIGDAVWDFTVAYDAHALQVIRKVGEGEAAALDASRNLDELQHGKAVAEQRLVDAHERLDLLDAPRHVPGLTLTVAGRLDHLIDRLRREVAGPLDASSPVRKP